MLEIGCGTSNLARRLWEKGFRSILVTDMSETALILQRRSCGMGHAIDFALIDCCKIPLQAATLRAVIDKGTLDALDCTDERDTLKCLTEVHRVLSDDGLYFLVSCRDPSVRMQDTKGLFKLLSGFEVHSAAKGRADPCPDWYFYIFQKDMNKKA